MTIGPLIVLCFLLWLVNALFIIALYIFVLYLSPTLGVWTTIQIVVLLGVLYFLNRVSLKYSVERSPR